MPAASSASPLSWRTSTTGTRVTSATLDYRKWAGRSLSLEVSVPVLGLVSRPRWPILYKTANPAFGWIFRKIHEDMRLTSLNRHRALDATLRFTRLNARLGRSFFWHVAYVHSDLPYSRPVDVLRHSIGVHRKLVATPGMEFYYHDANPQLVSGALQAVSGMTEERYAARYLFGPLGIEDYQWEHHADGLTFGAFGLWLRPRDMAKIGLMLARDGVWNGERIVSSEWLADAASPHTEWGDYGYYFWLVADGAFRAEGHGGQIIHASRSLDLVVVMTADPYSADAVLSPGMYGLIDRVLAAVVE